MSSNQIVEPNVKNIHKNADLFQDYTIKNYQNTRRIHNCNIGLDLKRAT